MKKLFTSIIFAIIFSAGFAQGCDTLFNLKSTTDTPYYYYAGAGVSSGYLSGNNEYGDQAKAEGFPAVIGDSLYSAVFYFQLAVINPQDSNSIITFGVWDNTGVTFDSVGTSLDTVVGAPGNIIDTATATLKQIAESISSSPASSNFDGYTFYGLLVNFASHRALTTDTFYVGVILPTTFGDTIVLLTNEVPPGNDGDGWEYTAYDTWNSYDYDWDITGGRMGNYISVEVCSAATGISTPNDDVTMKVFPNPASNQLNFEWNVDDAAEVAVYDVAGRMVKAFNIRGTALNTFDIHELAPGPYILRVTDMQTNLQRSALFTKTN